jgi:hypothetical protein
MIRHQGVVEDGDCVFPERVSHQREEDMMVLGALEDGTAVHASVEDVGDGVRRDVSGYSGHPYSIRLRCPKSSLLDQKRDGSIRLGACPLF